VPFLGFVVLSGIVPVVERYGGGPQLAVYLDPHASPEQFASVAASLRARKDVSAVEPVGRDQALADLARVEGLGTLLAGLAANPLPDAVLVTPGARDAESVETLRDQASRLPGVAEVEVDTAWIERLDALLRAGSLSMGMLGILMAVGVVACAFSITRLQVLTRTEEIAVAWLFGATSAQLRRPFLHLGALQGILAGLLAVGLAGLAAFWLRQEIGSVLMALGFPKTPLPALGDSAAVVAFAGVLGWIGAWISVSSHLDRLQD
jgi:cell division transport system permease protein